MIGCLLIENLHNHSKDIKEILAAEVPVSLRCEIKGNCIYLNLKVSEMTDEADVFIRHLHSELRGVSPEIRTGIASSRFGSRAAAHAADPSVPCVVSSEKTAAFLADQGVSVLPILPETLRRLRRLEFQTLGEVASLESHDLIKQRQVGLHN